MKNVFWKLLLILILSFLWKEQRGFAQTIVGGVISANTTWNLAGSPYIVQSQNIIVNSGVTLTIDPGVTVKFDATRSIQIDGTLRAPGTAAQPILFTANTGSPTPGFWGFILFNNSSTPYNFSNGTGSILQYCTIEYAGGVAVSNNGALRLDNAKPYINNCTIQNNSNHGINIFNLSGNIYINNSTVQNNTGTNINGINATSLNPCRLTVTGSTISNNTGDGIYKADSVNASIKNCVISYNGSNGVLSGGSAVGHKDTISNCTITLNNANGISSSSHSNNTYTITNNTINQNGQNGIYYLYLNLYSSSYNDTYTITNNILNRNNGSGIYLYYSSSAFAQTSHSLSMTKNIITNNNGVNGGGVRIESSQPNIGINSNVYQNVISGNRATGEGGAIFIDIAYGNTTITNNSFINNYAVNSSALYIKAPPTLTVNYNTIVWNKTTGTSPTRAVYIQTTVVATNHQFRYNNIYNTSCNSPFYELWFAGANNDSLNARNCYWNQSTVADVENVIYHYLDSSTLGRVNYNPFNTMPLISAPVTPVRDVQKSDLGGGQTLVWWTANPETDIAGYKIYWGNPTGYSFSNVQNVGNVTSYIFTGGVVTVNDTIEVTAYDNTANGVNDQVEGQESWFKGDEPTVFVPIALAANPSNTICDGQSVSFTATGANTYQFFVNGVSVQGPGSNNVYTTSSLTTGDSVKVTGTNACGTATSTPIVITVNPGPLPTVTASSSVPSICTGDTATLTASGATSYNWSPAIGLNTTTGATVEASPVSSTIYTVTGTSGGCSNTATVTVNVNPPPATPTITASGATTFCYGNNVTLTSSSAFSYSWNNGNTVQNNTISTTGSYIVTISDMNGCSAISAPVTVTVNPVPLANAGTDKIICIGQNTGIGSSSISGNTYSWSPATGLSSATISNPSANPTVSTVYILTQTITATGCNNKDTVTVTVNPLPAANTGSNKTICFGDSASIGSVPVSGNTYQWSPSLGLNDDTLSNPQASPQNTTVYSLTETILATGCSKTNSVTVTVNNLPVVTLSVFSDICEDAPPFTLAGGSPGGGIYSGTGVSAGTFYPDTAGVGTHSITYTYTDGNTCTASASKTITINPLPVVSFSILPSLCINSSPLVLSEGAPSGGVYSGTGVSSGSFSPSVAGAGTYMLTYTYTDGNGCVNQANQNITVNNLPAITFSSLSPVCINTPQITMSGGFPSGGTYSGTGVSSGNFYPSIAGVGNHTITYTYTDGNNCTNAANQNIEVKTLPAQPVISANGSDTICQGGSVVLSSIATADSYQWLFNNNSVAGATDTFYIATQAGDYTVEATNLCGTVVSSPLTIIQDSSSAPNVTLSAFAPVCLSTPAYALSGGSPAGGTYSGPGVSNGIFDPATAGLGTHTIIYTFTDIAGCSGSAMQDITVNSFAPVNFTGINPVCVNSPSFALSGGSPSGGIYSGNGVYNGMFYADSAGAGIHTLIYTYTDSVCSGSATQNIMVNALPAVTLPFLNPVCSNAPAFLLSGGAPGGGVYTGIGIINNYFYPSFAGAGNHLVIYSFSDNNGCSNSDSAVQTVNSTPSVSLTPFSSVCIGAAPLSLFGGFPVGGNYSGTGVNGNTFEPDSAGLGSHNIFYTYIDSSGCSGSASQSIIVTDSMTVTFVPLPMVCSNSSPFALSGGSPSGGSYSGTGVSGGIFYPAVSGTGTHTITYNYTSGSCSGSATQNIMVNSSPAVSLAPFAPVCLNSPGFVLSGGAPAGGIYSGGGILGGYFYPSLAGNGVHIITYTYTDSVNCSANTSQSILVSDSVPSPPVISGTTAICKGENTTLSVPQGNNYVWSTGETGSVIIVSPPATSVYNVTVSNNCGSATSYIIVSVSSLPFADAGHDTSLPLGASVQLNGSGGVSYQWSPSTGLNCSACQSPVATPQETTLYYLTVSDVNGCIATDSVLVSIDPEMVIFVPEVFSPNSDGANDYFHVLGKGIQSILLIVYDRWGNKVFEATDREQKWDGTHNGAPVNEGVYVYYLKVYLYNKQTIEQKGDVTVVR